MREIEVIVRPDDLLAHGLSAADLADQIGQTSLLQPIGQVQGPPLGYQILIDNQARTVQQIENIQLTVKGDRTVRVSDVADVQVLHEDAVQSIGYARKPAVAVSVFRRVGGNTVNVSQAVHALMDRDGLTLPPGDPHKPAPRSIQATFGYDQSSFVEASVGNVRDAIVVGGVFSVLILMLFLRSWRATLISALAIPTTLAITFLFLYWSGETLNLMSLGGLAVAIGLIIDDTVVVVENISRHLTPGGVAPLPEPPPRGAREQDKRPPPAGEGRGGGDADPVDAASKEITGAVIGSTLTTVLVFVPLAFIVGVYGQFFASLSWSLCIAVLVSMVVSLTVVPICAAKFLAGRPMPEPGPIYRFLAHLYDLLLEFVLRWPWATITASLAAVGVGVLLYTGVPNPMPAAKPPAGQQAPPRPPLVKGLETGLLPAMDEGAFTVDYFAPAGVPLEGTVERARVIEGILMENPDVKGYVRRSGTEMGVYATQTNKGDIQVALRPAEDDVISLLTKPVRPPLEDIKKELEKQGKELDEKEKEKIRKKYRRRSTDDVMGEIDDAITDHFSEHQLQHELMQIMQDELGDLSGASKPIEIRIYGSDQAVLRRLAKEVGDRLDEKGAGHGLTGVNSGVNEGNADLPITVDEQATGRIGLTPEAVRRQMAVMFAGQIAAQAPESSVRITNVRVRYPNALRFGPGWFDPSMALGQWVLLPEGKTPPPGVPQGPGRTVPLSAVARVTATRTPMEQWRENQQPAAFVTAELNEQEADLGTVAANVPHWLSDVSFPPGYRWELGGHVLQQQGAFQSLAAVMLTAVLLVYVMLAFQFRSVVLPLLIFLTQPLSIVSGLFALWITNTPLNVSSVHGRDPAGRPGHEERHSAGGVHSEAAGRGHGAEARPAAGGRTRFRPILMTSLAAILGLFPLALGIGPGAQMQQPLAVMVIGGLTANMLFTRAVIPAGYEVVERLFGRRAEGTPALAPAGPVAPTAPRRRQDGRSTAARSRTRRRGRPDASSGGRSRRPAGP